MADYKDSRKQERALARERGGFVNSGSGNGWVRKSDVRTEEELWEAKITSAKSFSLKDADLSKNKDYALVDGRIPLFLIQFLGSGNEWVVIDKEDYLELKERATFGNETT